jgi:hypothetical protein
MPKGSATGKRIKCVQLRSLHHRQQAFGMYTGALVAGWTVIVMPSVVNCLSMNARRCQAMRSVAADAELELKTPEEPPSNPWHHGGA